MGISTDMEDEIFIWDGDLWVPTSTQLPANKLLSSTSFLIKNRTILTPELHLARLTRQAKYWDKEFPIMAWMEALNIIHNFPDSWPRIDTLDDGSIYLRIRKAPQISDSVVVKTWDSLDPRAFPEVKGPDLTALLNAKQEINAQGADEAIICDEDGKICEGLTTSIIWWDGDSLCVPAESQSKLISTTLQAVMGVALGLGIEIKAESSSPSELHGKSVWALNALHGIRLVTEWIDGPEIAQNSKKVSVWQQMLDSLRVEVPTVR